jgi:hypothetical protein
VASQATGQRPCLGQAFGWCGGPAGQVGEDRKLTQVAGHRRGAGKGLGGGVLR